MPRTIRRLPAFERDYRREKRGATGPQIISRIAHRLTLLLDDQPLPARYRDHPLRGEWADHRDCHIRPDLILIYRKPDADRLELVRLGSHSELFS